MKPISRIRGTIVFAAHVWMAVAVAVPLGWAQTSGIPARATPSTPATPGPSNSTDQKPSELGVWHHFGETPSPPPAARAQSGGWRHFGGGDEASPVNQESPARPLLGLSRMEELELQMVELVNRDRADPANMPETNGRALPLRWNDKLAAVARAHSLDMLNRGYFAHQDPQGGTVATRVEAAGMTWQSVGENIAIHPSVDSAETAFMNEPRLSRNHRGNILDPNYTEIGIGITQGPDGRLYITQDFLTAPQRTAAR